MSTCGENSTIFADKFKWILALPFNTAAKDVDGRHDSTGCRLDSTRVELIVDLGIFIACEILAAT